MEFLEGNVGAFCTLNSSLSEREYAGRFSIFGIDKNQLRNTMWILFPMNRSER